MHRTKTNQPKNIGLEITMDEICFFIPDKVKINYLSMVNKNVLPWPCKDSTQILPP